MSETHYKILMFMKRRPGMSVEAFQEYYERSHAPLCAAYSSGMARYMRRFLTPQPNPETGSFEELDFDVITELWFENEKLFRQTVKYLSTTIMPDEVVQDKKQLFDRTRTRMATVVECESLLAK